MQFGTQRTTGVMVAGAYQRSGLTSCSRGKVTIHSPENLEDTACRCYNIVREFLFNLYQT